MDVGVYNEIEMYVDDVVSIRSMRRESNTWILRGHTNSQSQIRISRKDDPIKSRIAIVGDNGNGWISSRISTHAFHVPNGNIY